MKDNEKTTTADQDRVPLGRISGSSVSERSWAIVRKSRKRAGVGVARFQSSV